MRAHDVDVISSRKAAANARAGARRGRQAVESEPPAGALDEAKPKERPAPE